MTYTEAVRIFKREVAPEVCKPTVDYWTKQLAWSTWVDGLCKDGVITERQWQTWATPFAYKK